MILGFKLKLMGSESDEITLAHGGSCGKRLKHSSAAVTGRSLQSLRDGRSLGTAAIRPFLYREAGFR